MVALAAPAMAIETGPPDPRILPKSAPERRDFDAITHTLGDGWGAPYEITVAAKDGAVTTPKRLRQIQDFQTKLASDKQVQAVFGPGVIATQTAPLSRASAQLVKGRKQLSHSQRALGRLHRGLARAARGTEQLRSGLSTANAGAQRIASGSDSGQAGALQIQDGLSSAEHGAELLHSGLSRSSPGLAKLASGSRRARSGAGKLRAGILQIRHGAANGLPKVKKLRKQLLSAKKGLSDLRQPVGVANDNLDKALSELDQMGPAAKNDPHYCPVYTAVDAAKAAISGTDPLTGKKVSPGYDGLDAALAGASDGADQAAAAVSRIHTRTVKLLNGTKRLTKGSGDLRQALKRISAGATRLRNPDRAGRVAAHEELFERRLRGRMVGEELAKMPGDGEQPCAVASGPGDEGAAGKDKAGAGEQSESRAGETGIDSEN